MSIENVVSVDLTKGISELAAGSQEAQIKITDEAKDGGVVCRDFAKGKCDRGSSCKFVHPVNSMPKLDEQVVCRDYLKGRCDRGIACKFSHPDGGGVAGGDDASAQKDGNVVCRDFLKGSCTRGGSCKFHHPENVPAQVRSNLVACQDFQSKKCDRDPCRYLHITKKEEALYRQVGIGSKADSLCHDHLKGNCARGQTCRFHHCSVEELSADGVCRDYLKKNCNRAGRCRYRHVSDKEYALEKQFLELTGMNLPDAIRYGFSTPPPIPRPPMVHGSEMELAAVRPLKRAHEEDDSVGEENRRLRRKVNELQSQLLDLQSDNTELQRQILKLRESNEELTEHLERLRGQPTATPAPEVKW